MAKFSLLMCKLYEVGVGKSRSILHGIGSQIYFFFLWIIHVWLTKSELKFSIHSSLKNILYENINLEQTFSRGGESHALFAGCICNF